MDTTAGSFVDSRFACTRHGYVVKLAGNFPGLKGQPSPDFWLREYLEAKGWTRSHWYDGGGVSHADDAYEVTVSCGGAERKAPDLQN